LKIALFVEGESDRRTISVFVKRILGEHVGIVFRVFRGKGKLFDEREVRAVAAFALKEHPDISKIIVCFDTECTPPQEARKEAERMENLLRDQVNRPVYYLSVIHALEGWLLADPEGVGKYLSAGGKIRVSPSSTLECRPKEVMRSLFRKAGRSFHPTHDNPKIALKIDINKAMQHNKSFSEFRDLIEDP